MPTVPECEARNAAGIARHSAPAIVGGSGQIRQWDQRGLHCIFVWNFNNSSNWQTKFPNNPGFFTRVFQSDANQTGQQEFMKRGPLAGAFIRVGQFWQPGPAESSLESPMRFEIDVYEPAKFGYTKVLSFLSKDRYASNNSDRGAPDPISVLTPEIGRALKAVYPDGKSSVLGQ